MQAMNRISVIMPTYNCANYIQEAINSILTQTLQPEEIIVVDDGSTDNTASIIASIKDDRIKYLKQKNSGVSSARNMGLNNAIGDFIAFLDADDKWRPTMLEEQASILNNHPEIVFSFTNFVRFSDLTGEVFIDQFSFYPEINKISKASTTEGSITVVKEDAFCTLIKFGEIPGYTQSIMYRRDAISNIRFNCDLRICEDAEFTLRVSTKGKIAFNSKVLLDVRRHSSNATADISKITFNKLQAILSLQLFNELKPHHKVALNERLVKSYIDSAVISLHIGSIKNSISYYLKSFQVKGYYTKKLKGLVRLLIETKKFNSANTGSI